MFLLENKKSKTVFVSKSTDTNKAFNDNLKGLIKSYNHSEISAISKYVLSIYLTMLIAHYIEKKITTLVESEIDESLNKYLK